MYYQIGKVFVTKWGIFFVLQRSETGITKSNIY